MINQKNRWTTIWEHIFFYFVQASEANPRKPKKGPNSKSQHLRVSALFQEQDKIAR